MARIDLNKDIKYLPGVGPKRAELLGKELGIKTFGDLLFYFPYKYVDRSKFYKISELSAELPYIQLRGKIAGLRLIPGKGKKRLVADFCDETGSIELVWFQGAKWLKDSLKANTEYIVFGKPNRFKRTINIVHPEIEEWDKYEQAVNASLQAHYITTERMKNSYITSRVMYKLMGNLFRSFDIDLPETLPDYLRKKARLIPRDEALKIIHFPDTPEHLRSAEYRLKFEELFNIQLNILRQKVYREQKTSGFVFARVAEFTNRFYEQKLPFELTEAQKRVLREIRKDLGSGKQMNRLLQGDVGSGKTLVALMSMLIALDNGYQACMMAPTEILAGQHYRTLNKMTEGLGINIQLLTGSTRQKERTPLHDELKKGEVHILVGTHALIEETVIFKNLGMVIIDEQHRFGVAQRAKLWQKSTHPPHVMVMTATPIPRTLAMTVYGDLNVSVIDELPPGRKPVKTLRTTDAKRMRLHGFLRKQIEEGRQIYVVYPLIKESEKMDYKDLEDGYESLKRAFPPPRYAVGVLHGKMKPEEKDIAMGHFVAGRTHILVSTTVIEVGVDVPNATVMVIESAERFGLSQLHQLRGRVGRGADQSWCILMTQYQLGEEARTRLETMVRTNDGFEIAEVDLRLRGPGDIEGTQQSGIPFDLKIANLGKDNQILNYARDLVSEILDVDPALAGEENRVLRQNLDRLSKEKIDWSQVG